MKNAYENLNFLRVEPLDVVFRNDGIVRANCWVSQSFPNEKDIFKLFNLAKKIKKKLSGNHILTLKKYLRTWEWYVKGRVKDYFRVYKYSKSKIFSLLVGNDEWKVGAVLKTLPSRR